MLRAHGHHGLGRFMSSWAGRLGTVVATGSLALTVGIQSASACGGLVSPNGAVRLDRASTLVAWHGGVEHYMTSFAFSGDAASFGWIVPLPVNPDRIEEGGAWTLQRLERETNPVRTVDAPRGEAAAAAPGAQVLQQARVEALDITVLSGQGQAVIDWCANNGFFLDPITRAHILGYAKGSPIFMAAKYDVAAAHARGQRAGDGAPVLLTMHIPHPWVPLEVLAVDRSTVSADVYLVSDEPLTTAAPPAFGRTGHPGLGSLGQQNQPVPGAPGLRITFQEPMNPSLYHDLSTDRNMSWIPSDAWLTRLSLQAPAEDVTYDLGVTADGTIKLAGYGTPPMQVAAVASSDPSGGLSGGVLLAIWLGASGVAILVVTVAMMLRRRGRAESVVR